jgi:guanine deaminase
MSLLTKYLQAKKCMGLAMAQASKGARKNHGGPFGAVIISGARVVAEAHNEVIKTKDPTAHAEIVAIRKASAKLNRFDLSDCELYSTCEPCPMCLAAIYWARIPKVYFGCTRKDAEKIGFRDRLLYNTIRKRAPRGLEMIKAERKQCLKLFEEWRQKKDKVMY